MPRTWVQVELHIDRRQDASAAWQRMFEWLMSDDKNDPEAEDRGRQGSPEVESDDADSA